MIYPIQQIFSWQCHKTKADDFSSASLHNHSAFTHIPRHLPAATCDQPSTGGKTSIRSPFTSQPLTSPIFSTRTCSDSAHTVRNVDSLAGIVCVASTCACAASC